MLHLFNSVKLCYFACLKHMIGLIKRGQAGLSSTENTYREKGGAKSEKERRTPGASHAATQPATE